jgi:DNA-binding response OmpR family regulator
MDVLLIESDARRRVTVAKHLAGSHHRVTLASSVDEAQEILRLVTDERATPNAVIIDEKLHRGEGRELRAELAVRFPSTNWIPLREDLELDWLARWLELLASREVKSRKRKAAASLDIVLIEADDTLRKVLGRHLALWGDRVAACASLSEARAALGKYSGGRSRPHAIVSRVAVGEGDGIGFYLNVRRRFPKTRWIVISSPDTQPPSPKLSETAMDVLDDLRRARRDLQQPPARH